MKHFLLYDYEDGTFVGDSRAFLPAGAEGPIHAARELDLLRDRRAMGYYLFGHAPAGVNDGLLCVTIPANFHRIDGTYYDLEMYFDALQCGYETVFADYLNTAELEN
jgi:hypothetical protein